MTELARSGALRHLKVLDMSRMYPGAFCSLILADLGADVLKVEGPGIGDGLRAMKMMDGFNASHAALNRGKRSFVLDIRNPDAGPVMRRLALWADVVIESHKPGALDRKGIGYSALRDENPKLVWCSITGFGDFGGNTELPGHDITYLGYAGLLSLLSAGETTPPGAPISLPLSGLMAAVGILAAWSDAQQSGVGARLDVNMCDTAMWTLSEDVARAAHVPRPGWGTSAARNVYSCADGRQVTVAASEPRTWAALCEALGAPELAAFRPGVDDDTAATARVAACLRSKRAAHWVENPGMTGGIGPVNDVADLVSDLQVTDRGSLVPLPGSGHRVLANPIRFDSEDGLYASHGLSDAPSLGEHTSMALRDVGFTDDEISSLRQVGVVA